MENSLLQQGIQAAKAGDKAQAQRFLRQALKLNPRNVTAWLWLSGIVDSDQEKRQCMKIVLAIDPDNEIALRNLPDQAQPVEPEPPQPQPQPQPAAHLVERPAHLVERPAHLVERPPTTAQTDLVQGVLQELRNIAEKIEALTHSLRPDPSPAPIEVVKADAETVKPRIKAALFVDFDNIYIGLDTIDPAAAERFATDPARWLKWIEQGMQSIEDERPRSARTVLVRRCYLNPTRGLEKFRPDFMRSAFSVVECPPLTRRGKTSSDIRMVMDILDTLQHQTHFDEFIILSGDADFTPVLFQLRAHNYRTTVIAIGPAAGAYKAACDRVITEDSFIEDALGISEQPDADAEGAPPPEASTVAPDVLDAVAKRVYEEVSASGDVLATGLPRIFKEFPEFPRGKNWFGFSTLRVFTRELVRRRPELRMTEGNPWRVSMQAGPAGAVEPDLQTKIIERVREIVADADDPVLMAKAAQKVIHSLGPQVTKTRWAGARSFKSLLQNAEGRGFEVFTTANSPGYLYDPERHKRPAGDSPANDLKALPANLYTFLRRINQVVGTPALHPRQYKVVFEAISDELKEHPYNFVGTSKAVRDLCIERGESVSRKNVSFILRGISYAGYPLGKNPEDDTALKLGTAFRNSVLTQAGDAQLELTDDERAMLDEWILGGFDG